jgi:hypothetical protein
VLHKLIRKNQPWTLIRTGIDQGNCAIRSDPFFRGPLGIGPYADKREAVFAFWRKNLAELARCANVVVKLGGLTMTMSGFGWHRRDWQPAVI